LHGCGFFEGLASFFAEFLEAEGICGLVVKFGGFFEAGGASSAEKATLAGCFFLGLYIDERTVLVLGRGDDYFC